MLLQKWSMPRHQLTMSLFQSGLTFTFVAPVLACAYIGWNGMLHKGKSVVGIHDDVRSQFFPIMASDALFWPAADCINFRFAPPALRFYFMLAEDVLWSAILSMWGHSSPSEMLVSSTMKTLSNVHATPHSSWLYLAQ